MHENNLKASGSIIPSFDMSLEASFKIKPRFGSQPSLSNKTLGELVEETKQGMQPTEPLLTKQDELIVKPGELLVSNAEVSFSGPKKDFESSIENNFDELIARHTSQIQEAFEKCKSMIMEELADYKSSFKTKLRDHNTQLSSNILRIENHTVGLMQHSNQDLGMLPNINSTISKDMLEIKEEALAYQQSRSEALNVAKTTLNDELNLKAHSVERVDQFERSIMNDCGFVLDNHVQGLLVPLWGLADFVPRRRIFDPGKNNAEVNYINHKQTITKILSQRERGGVPPRWRIIGQIVCDTLSVAFYYA